MDVAVLGYLLLQPAFNYTKVQQHKNLAAEALTVADSAGILFGR